MYYDIHHQKHGSHLQHDMPLHQVVGVDMLHHLQQNNAMKYISTGLLAISGYFTPIFSAILAAILFRESVTCLQIMGMILVFGSAFIEPEIAEGFMGKIGKKKNRS